MVVRRDVVVRRESCVGVRLQSGQIGVGAEVLKRVGAGAVFQTEGEVCCVRSHRRFVPFSLAEARLQLEGRQTAGIYPLLVDETCWLVAVDLDGTTWREDVSALRDTAEISMYRCSWSVRAPGAGRDLWVLFSRPVPARFARAAGSLLLTRAMSHAISMDLYDRLFPNQDTMPTGGFGNLVALPLQHAGGRSGARSSWMTTSSPSRINGPILLGRAGSTVRRSRHWRRYPLALTERREHLAAIAAVLEARTDRVAVLHGGLGVRAR